MGKVPLANKIRFNLATIFNQKTTELDGSTLSVDKKDIPREIRKSVFYGNYEEQERKLLNRAGLIPSDRVLDLGTCVGVVSIAAAKLVGSENVHTYEANPALEPIIRRNFKLNNVSPQLHLKAVTSDGRDIELHLQDRIFSSSLMPRQSRGVVQVKSASITSMMNEFNPTVVSMDVEGAEAEIVSATDFAGVRAIMLEVHPNIIGAEAVDGIFKRLKSLGFSNQIKMDDVHLFSR